MSAIDSVDRLAAASGPRTPAGPNAPAQPASRTWARRLAFWSLAVIALAWAFLDPRFRDAEGFLQGRFGLPLAAGFALLLIGAALSTPLRPAAGWFALLLVGQAVALQLVVAGPFMRYQHFRPLEQLTSEIGLILGPWLVAQTMLVVLGLRARWATVRRWTGRAFGRWQLLGTALVFGLTSATVSPSPLGYLGELLFATFVQAVNLGTLALALLALPASGSTWLQSRLDALLGPWGRPDATAGGRLDRFAGLAAAWVVALAALLALVSYERHPHVPDEVAYVLQARFLAAGALTLPAPPVPDAFVFYLVDFAGGQWYLTPPPGWPAVLAIGTWLGAPWLVNPVLAGANLLLAYLLLQSLYDRRTARLGALLLAASPWHLFLAMSFMTHTFALTCSLLAAVTMAWARRNGSWGWGAISGGAVGMVIQIRPLEGLVLGGLLGLWALGLNPRWSLGSNLRRVPFVMIGAYGLGAAAFLGTVLFYNAALTGDPRTFPIMAYTDKLFGPNANAMGFGPDRGIPWPLDPFPGHGLPDAIVNANLNLFSLNVELFGWTTGSLLLIALFVLSGRLRQGDYLMLAVIAATFGAHVFYWFSGGPDFGARYWYLMLVPLVALAARAVHYLEQRVRSLGGAAAAAVVPAAVLGLSALALLTFFPWRAVDKYHHYLQMRPDVRELAREHGFGKSLVLIQGDEHDYASTVVYNPLDLQAAEPVYAWDRDPELTTKLLEGYRDRPVWLIEGPSLTGRGYRIVGGPVPAHQLLGS